MTPADLLIDARGVDIRHRSGITAPDEFFYLREENGTETVFFDAREFAIQKSKLESIGSRARIEALEPYLEAAYASVKTGSVMQKTLLEILAKKGITVVRISPNLSYAWALFLKESGIDISVYDYSSERLKKSDADIQEMIKMQRITEQAFELVRSILRESTIDGDHLLYNGKTLTSEYVKSEVKKFLMDHECSCPEGIIVASGDQAACPHDEGTGPILANSTIVVDMFPVSDKTGYFADMTRTFVKGQPSAEALAIFTAVRDVQKEIADGVQLGDRGEDIYLKTVDAFKVRGYETSAEKGFMHGTGHGLGLAVHEAPNLKKGSTHVLGEGMVFTVEPGLYYPGIGGVRIEDVILFHPDGRKENINTFDTDFIIS